MSMPAAYGTYFTMAAWTETNIFLFSYDYENKCSPWKIHAMYNIYK